jgi:hypothetical protein
MVDGGWPDRAGEEKGGQEIDERKDIKPIHPRWHLQAAAMSEWCLVARMRASVIY